MGVAAKISPKIAAIGEVIRSRQAAKRARGECFGNPPFGWRFVGGKRLENPEEQATLRMIRVLDESGASLREMAQELVRARRTGRFCRHLSIVRLCQLRAQLRAERRACAPGDAAP